jgi:mannitol-specific phosphotransferase system IIBC component
MKGMQTMDKFPFTEEPSTPPSTMKVVIIAALVAFVVGCLPALGTALVAVNDLKETQEQIIEGRAEVTRLSCENQNRQAKASNSHKRYIERMIIDGVKSSKVFENIYRKYGAPPYKERLRLAQQQAKDLQSRHLPMVDCKKLEQQVRNQR